MSPIDYLLVFDFLCFNTFLDLTVFLFVNDKSLNVLPPYAELIIYTFLTSAVLSLFAFKACLTISGGGF